MRHYFSATGTTAYCVLACGINSETAWQKLESWTKFAGAGGHLRRGRPLDMQVSSANAGAAISNPSIACTILVDAIS
jgi:hypothetical protein